LDDARDAVSTVRHPVFARVLDRVSEREERLGQAEHREAMLHGVSGRVLELGAGNGINFRHYPPSVSEVVAVEPEPYLRERAEEAARSAAISITVVDALGGALPFEDGSFDAAVASLVLCTVPDQREVLSDLFRVVRPGGELRFYEHVRAADPRRARLQDAITPVWRRLGGGCHPNRDTGAAIEAAGFSVESCQTVIFTPCFLCAPAARRIIGTARRPSKLKGSVETVNQQS
jgi:ubiquinone/menaquinone biosynthesis C-methylase UbiE